MPTLARIAFVLLAALTLALIPHFSDAQKSDEAAVEYDYFDKGEKITGLFLTGGEVEGLKITIGNELSEKDKLDYDISTYSNITTTMPDGTTSTIDAQTSLMFYLDFNGIEERPGMLRLSAKYGAIRMLTRQDGETIELVAIGNDTARGVTTSSSLLFNGVSPPDPERAGLPDAGTISTRMGEPVAFALLSDSNELSNCAHAISFNNQVARKDPGYLLDPLAFLRLLFAGWSAESLDEHGVGNTLEFATTLATDSASGVAAPYLITLKLREVYGDNDKKEATCADYDIEIAPRAVNLALDLTDENSLRFAPPSFKGSVSIDLKRGVIVSAQLDGTYPQTEAADGMIGIAGKTGVSIALRVEKKDDSSSGQDK